MRAVGEGEWVGEEEGWSKGRWWRKERVGEGVGVWGESGWGKDKGGDLRQGI